MQSIIAFILKRVNIATIIAALDQMLNDLIAKKASSDPVRAQRFLLVKHIAISVISIMTDEDKENQKQLADFINANDVMTDVEKQTLIKIVSNVL